MLVIEAEVIIFIEGGIRIPRVAPAAIEPRFIFSSYFLFESSGIAIVPIVAVVATEDPDTEANKPDANIFV